MDVISLGKATQALNAIKDLNDNIIAPLAEGRFPTVKERLDWLEAQASKTTATSSSSIDLSQGTFSNTEFFEQKNPTVTQALRLLKTGEVKRDPVDLSRYTSVVYVDSMKGDDAAGDGSPSKPYATMAKAVGVAVSGGAVFATGTFALGQGYTFKAGVDFIGAPGKTIFQGSQWVGNTNNIYRVILDGAGYGETQTFTGTMNLYNVVSRNQYSADSGTREMFNGFNGKIYNCLFIPGNWNTLTYNSNTITAKNNAFAGTANYSSVFQLIGVTYDSDYRITSSGWQGTGTNEDGTATNVGVYGGPYAWDAVATASIYASSGMWESPTIDLGEGWIGNKEITITDTSKAGGYVSAIPTMTSNTAPSGIVTTSGDLSTTYAGWKAFDNVPSSNTWWTVGTAAAWIAYQFPTPKTITKYAIMSHAGVETPGVFTFEGWDGSKWVVLDSQTVTSWINFTIKEFVVPNPGSYIKYRINSTKTVGGGTTTGIREIYMYETLPGLDINYEIAYSDDGVNYSAFEKLSPATPPSKRYLKFRAFLSSVAAAAPEVRLDFNQTDDQNRFVLDEYTQADGKLGLKTSYTKPMTYEGMMSTGKQFSYSIDRSKFKKINGLEV